MARQSVKILALVALLIVATMTIQVAEAGDKSGSVVITDPYSDTIVHGGKKGKHGNIVLRDRFGSGWGK